MNALVNGGAAGDFGAGKAPAQRLCTQADKPEKETVQICAVTKEGQVSMAEIGWGGDYRLSIPTRCTKLPALPVF